MGQTKKDQIKSRKHRVTTKLIRGLCGRPRPPSPTWGIGNRPKEDIAPEKLKNWFNMSDNFPYAQTNPMALTGIAATVDDKNSVTQEKGRHLPDEIAANINAQIQRGELQPG